MALGTSSVTDLKSPEDTSVHQGMLTVMTWSPGEEQTVCTPWGEVTCGQKLMRSLAMEAVGVSPAFAACSCAALGLLCKMGARLFLPQSVVLRTGWNLGWHSL